MKKKIYLEINEAFSAYNHINHDFVIIHDPQPLPLINYYRKVQPWIWRCHIDLSNPNKEMWEYLKGFVLKYDLEIVSHQKYKNDLPVNYKIIHPAIDPLTSKNIDLKSHDIKKILSKFRIPLDKPIVTQISRFDKWKDPVGVIDIYKKVRKKRDCRLILCGSMASDDPEGIRIYEQVKSRANDLVEKGEVILIASENNVLVNVLQRESAVIIQKSLREGFGLTVTEALWKGTPVVASNVGGIPLQITDGKNGFLVDPKDSDGFADRIIELLKNPKLGLKLGKAAKEYVREKFLITRILQDYIQLLNEIF
jgi:trehalose synthase